jgi:hypothetical protein
VMPNRQPGGTGVKRDQVEAELPVPVSFAQPVGAPGAQQVGAFAGSHAVLGQAAAGVDAIAHFHHHHPAGILSHEVDLAGAFAQVASKDAETAQAKKGGREILCGTPAILTRNNPARRRRVARASGIDGERLVEDGTHARSQAPIVPRGATTGVSHNEGARHKLLPRHANPTAQSSGIAVMPCRSDRRGPLLAATRRWVRRGPRQPAGEPGPSRRTASILAIDGECRGRIRYTPTLSETLFLPEWFYDPG